MRQQDFHLVIFDVLLLGWKRSGSDGIGGGTTHQYTPLCLQGQDTRDVEKGRTRLRKDKIETGRRGDRESTRPGVNEIRGSTRLGDVEISRPQDSEATRPKTAGPQEDEEMRPQDDETFVSSSPTRCYVLEGSVNAVVSGGATHSFVCSQERHPKCSQSNERTRRRRGRGNETAR
jgi:hypothetical protein